MKIEVWKETRENWAPSYKMADSYTSKLLLSVTYHGDIMYGSNPSEQLFRVSVWGADDTGMEFDTKDCDEALNIFHQVIALPFLSFSNLKDLGFVNA